MLAAHGVELSARNRRPAAFLADAGNGFGVTGIKIFNRPLRRFGDVTQGMNADFELVGRVPGAPAIFPIDVNERTESPCLAANDGNHEWQSQRPGSGERFRCPAHAQPDRERILQRTWIDALAGERRTVFAGPMNEFVFAQPQKQIQFLRKQRIVILEFQAKQWKCLGE